MWAEEALEQWGQEPNVCCGTAVLHWSPAAVSSCSHRLYTGFHAQLPRYVPVMSWCAAAEYCAAVLHTGSMSAG